MSEYIKENISDEEIILNWELFSDGWDILSFLEMNETLFDNKLKVNFDFNVSKDINVFWEKEDIIKLKNILIDN